jgi:protein-disulfide isomerase
MEAGMTPVAKNNSCLPWIILLAVIAVCLMCAMCSLGGTGLYFFSRSRASGVAAVSVTPSSGPETWRQAGNANAKVVVVEFADFQCPYCGQFFIHGEPKLRAEYIQTGKILFIFRNFPILDENQADGESHLAALGALCAGEQGKFWEFHDTLFQNQSGENSGGFAAPHLEGFAQQLGLDSARFHQCLQTQRYQSILDEDIRLGKNRNLSGVPAFLINGNVILGYDETTFFAAIDKALGGPSF